jgi:hypothetical protein
LKTAGFELMTEGDEEALDLDAAKRYYAGLDKSERVSGKSLPKSAP